MVRCWCPCNPTLLPNPLLPLLTHNLPSARLTCSAVRLPPPSPTAFQQIDADLECDALGWQYVSGCLADAHPFHYLLDLDKEWQRFDPQGHYVRRWLPVLSQLPSQFIHRPWAAPPEVLEEAGG
jgi:hypothetical protein